MILYLSSMSKKKKSKVRSRYFLMYFLFSLSLASAPRHQNALKQSKVWQDAKPSVVFIACLIWPWSAVRKRGVNSPFFCCCCFGPVSSFLFFGTPFGLTERLVDTVTKRPWRPQTPSPLADQKYVTLWQSRKSTIFDLLPESVLKYALDTS